MYEIIANVACSDGYSNALCSCLAPFHDGHLTYVTGLLRLQ